MALGRGEWESSALFYKWETGHRPALADTGPVLSLPGAGADSSASFFSSICF